MAHWSIPQIALFWIHNGGLQTGVQLTAAVAVCLAESGGNDHAIGPAGDYGLWQINHTNFKAYGLNSSTALDPNRNARVAVAMSGAGRNWAAWCTAWANPGPNCGHGNLPVPEIGSPADDHWDEVVGALRGVHLGTGVAIAGGNDATAPSNVITAWGQMQTYYGRTAPAHWKTIDGLQKAFGAVRPK